MLFKQHVLSVAVTVANLPTHVPLSLLNDCYLVFGVCLQCTVSVHQSSSARTPQNITIAKDIDCKE